MVHPIADIGVLLHHPFQTIGAAIQIDDPDIVNISRHRLMKNEVATVAVDSRSSQERLADAHIAVYRVQVDARNS